MLDKTAEAGAAKQKLREGVGETDGQGREETIIQIQESLMRKGKPSVSPYAMISF